MTHVPASAMSGPAEVAAVLPVATTAQAAAPAAPNADVPAREVRAGGDPKTPPSAAPLAGADAVAPAAVPSAASVGAEAHPATQAAVGAVAAAPAARTGVDFPTRAPTATATAQVPARPLGEAPSGAGAVGGALFSLVLVIALILGLAWLARRMPGMARNTGAGQALRVVASLNVGQREKLMVVDVGGTQLLLGSGTGGLRTLHTLERPLQAETGAPAGPSPFAQILAQHFGKKSA